MPGDNTQPTAISVAEAGTAPSKLLFRRATILSSSAYKPSDGTTVGAIHGLVARVLDVPVSVARIDDITTIPTTNTTTNGVMPPEPATLYVIVVCPEVSKTDVAVLKGAAGDAFKGACVVAVGSTQFANEVRELMLRKGAREVLPLALKEAAGRTDIGDEERLERVLEGWVRRVGGTVNGLVKRLGNLRLGESGCDGGEKAGSVGYTEETDRLLDGVKWVAFEPVPLDLKVLLPPDRPSVESLSLPFLPQPTVTVHQATPHTRYSPRRRTDLYHTSATHSPSRHQPALCPITAVERLTGADAAKETFEVTIELRKWEWAYRPGDAFGVWAPNHPALVNQILARMALFDPCGGPDTAFAVSGTSTASLPSCIIDKFATEGDEDGAPMTLSAREVLTWLVDLGAFPKKGFLRLLAERSSDPAEKNALLFLSSKQGSKTLNALRHLRPTLLDWLASFPSARIGVEDVLSALPTLRPRYYSITTSPSNSPQHVKAAFNLVRYRVGGTESQQAVERLGVASSFLVSAPCVLVFPHPTKTFLLPPLPSVPLILVAAGTGIAPFMSFLDHRKGKHEGGSSRNVSALPTPSTERHPPSSLGPVWLFHGFRSPSADWLYRTRFSHYDDLTYVPCVSRPALHPVPETGVHGYVQSGLARHRASMLELVRHRDARVYVCGDAVNGMLAGVRALWETWLGKDGLKELCDQGRFIVDVWA